MLWLENKGYFQLCTLILGLVVYMHLVLSKCAAAYMIDYKDTS